MENPFVPPEPTEIDKLWELFWAVNEYINSDGSFDKIDDTFQWLNDWLMENSDPCTPSR